MGGVPFKCVEEQITPSICIKPLISQFAWIYVFKNGSDSENRPAIRLLKVVSRTGKLVNMLKSDSRFKVGGQCCHTFFTYCINSGILRCPLVA